ncbi:DNA adenine methylase, partial [Candidatus Sumerlaeota bacterium]|nr:DNA adenine methylase [Candidatus Sumerlaeota bacterium]
WNKDILIYTRKALSIISPRFAIVKGNAFVADAIATAKILKDGDLAFIDPPYSGVQYSRFYHVLETIARGEAIAVFGTGRYPDRALRPQSRFSLKRHSQKELWNLLKTISDKKIKAILTFPSHECSNGLSGTIIQEMAKELFDVKVNIVESKFSTLGGNNKSGTGREAKRITKELILTLYPRY